MEQSEATVSQERLRTEIVSFLEGYSIEITPHDEPKLDSIATVLPPGTEVFVAHPPGMPLDDIVDLSGRVKQLGFSPVPHIIARKFESRDRLAWALGALRELGIDRALVVAGDLVVENNAFDSSLEVLQTGLFGEFGFTEVGVAGHPEGSKAIGDAIAEQALRDKAAFASDAGFAIRIMTQFGFDPEAVTAWEHKTASEGVTLPVRVGMAGPASLRQLARFAMLCGVGASARMLMTRTGATANLLKTRAPDDLVTHIARHRVNEPSSRLGGAHFFAFGGVVKTASWANAVVEGRFELNSKGTGFDVEKP